MSSAQVDAAHAARSPVAVAHTELASVQHSGLPLVQTSSHHCPLMAVTSTHGAEA